MNTLALSAPNIETGGWDLTIDVAGNIAIATGTTAIAQDVASAVRTFLSELWYDTTQGVPYFQQILGQLPSLQFLKAKFIAAGLTVPGTVSIACFLTGPGKTREIGGQLQITDNTGALSVLGAPTLGSLWYISGAQ